MQPHLHKLNDIRGYLSAALGREITRQLAWKYTQRKDFPNPVYIIPMRLWYAGEVTRWIGANILPLQDDGKAIKEAAQDSQQLRRDIRGLILASGGISRDSAFWSRHLTANENRRMFGYLDRVNGHPQTLDRLAQEIADVYPAAGIQDSDDLINYLSEG